MHVSLAVATIVAFGVAAIEGAGRALLGRPPSRSSAAAAAIALVLLGMTAAAGLAMLVRGERPKEFLHFVYAALAFAIVLFADSLATRGSLRRRAGARLIGALITLGVLARLLATG
jgi:hypothetical protein